MRAVLDKFHGGIVSVWLKEKFGRICTSRGWGIKTAEGLNEHLIIVERAPEPSDIFFEHLAATNL